MSASADVAATTPTGNATSAHLPATTLLIYSGPAAALSVLTFALIVYVPAFYTSEAQLSLTTAGLLFLLARAWDAVVDPLVGLWTDATRSRWGRRKPWIALGVPALALITWLLFRPPVGAGPTYLLVTVFLYYLAWTAVQIPYLSWGAELTGDYRERNRVVGFREGVAFVGVLLATGLPLLVFAGSEPGLRDILGLFALIAVAALPVTAALALWRVPSGGERPPEALAWREIPRVLRRNRPLLVLLLACFLLWLGMHIYNASILFVIEYSLGFPPARFLQLVFVQFLVGVAVTPFIVRLADRYGKHRVLGLAAIGVGVVLPLILLVPAGRFEALVAIFALLGVVISPVWVLPTALVADAVDFGRLKGGRDQSGLYMALYNLVIKAAIALSVGIALPLMAVMGFDPHDEVQRRITTGVNFTGLMLPGLLWVMACALLWRYPIDSARHEVIRRWLARAHRAQGMSPPTPRESSNP